MFFSSRTRRGQEIKVRVERSTMYLSTYNKVKMK